MYAYFSCSSKELTITIIRVLIFLRYTNTKKSNTFYINRNEFDPPWNIKIKNKWIFLVILYYFNKLPITFVALSFRDDPLELGLSAAIDDDDELFVLVLLALLLLLPIPNIFEALSFKEFRLKAETILLDSKLINTDATINDNVMPVITNVLCMFFNVFYSNILFNWYNI